MKVYAVFKQAVYRHECGGIFSTLELAKLAADNCARGDQDGHHHYEVIEFTLDVPTEQDPLIQRHPEMPWTLYGGDLNESDSLYSVKRANRAAIDVDPIELRKVLSD